MRRPCCIAVLALGIATLRPTLARAAAFVCDAGACIDADGDGFTACACTAAGLACDCDDADPSTFPGAPEACDAPKDQDCNGRAVEGCAAGTGCFEHVCVPECIPLDDFGCPVGSYFATGAAGQCLCAPLDCTLFGCAPGDTCSDAKTCRPTCGPDVRCPADQICRGEGCVDACDADDRASTCDGVVCPDRRVCRVTTGDSGVPRARCVDLCATPCTLGFECAWRTGECERVPAATGGLVPPPEAKLDDDLRVAGGGLACSNGPAAGGLECTLLALFVASALARRRRRPPPNVSRRG